MGLPIRIPHALLKEVAPDFLKIQNEYTFDYKLHRYSILNIGIEPSVIPVMLDSLIKERRLLTWDQLLSQMKRIGVKATGWQRFSYRSNLPDLNEETVILARSKQFHTGFLREMHVMIRLSQLDPKGIIERDQDADLGDGASDIIYTRSSDYQQFIFAVRHQGDSSKDYEEKRKNSKKASNVIVLSAPNTGGSKLHLVPDEQIMKYTSSTDFFLD